MLRHMLMHVPVRGVPVRMMAAMVPVAVPAMDGARMVLGLTLCVGTFLRFALAGVSGCCNVLVGGCCGIGLRSSSSLGAGGRCRTIGLLRSIRQLCVIRLRLRGLAGDGLGIGFSGSGSWFGGKSAASGKSYRHQAHESDN
ncbi:MAG: hypothetical protein ACLPX9_18600 [Rhodomicrobium sp.]